MDGDRGGARSGSVPRSSADLTTAESVGRRSVSSQFVVGVLVATEWCFDGGRMS